MRQMIVGIQFQKSELNLLGQICIKEVGISADSAFQDVEARYIVSSNLTADTKLEEKCEKCKKLCSKCTDLWKLELGCLTHYELKVKFKQNVQPIFWKGRPAPFAKEADLKEQYQKGFTIHVWENKEFCKIGTPVVLIKKNLLP